MTGGVKFTLDTNILIYAIDAAAPSAKQATSVYLVDRGAVSRQPLALQSLNEFAHAVGKKKKASPSLLRQFIGLHASAFTVIPASFDDLDTALTAQHTYKLQFWDALLWATARRAGCRVLFSEDFQDGRLLEGVRIVNPFLKTRTQIKEILANI